MNQYSRIDRMMNRIVLECVYASIFYWADNVKED